MEIGTFTDESKDWKEGAIMVHKRKITELDHRAIEAFELLSQSELYAWLDPLKIRNYRLSKTEFRKLLKIHFSEGYRFGYSQGFTQQQEGGNAKLVSPLNKHPTDPRQLAPIGLLELCREYKALGETLGSNQGLADKFQHQKFKVEETLNKQLKLLKLTEV